MAFSNFADYKYVIDINDQRQLDGYSNSGAITTGVYTFVYTAGTKTLATIYSNQARGSRSNPITRAQFLTDGKLVFYSSAASHDLFVAHSDGSVAFYAGVTPQTHQLKISRTNVEKCLIFPMLFIAGGTEVDTTLDLPYGALVHDAKIEVVDVDATETCDMGLLSSETSGDADGFLAAVSVATAGIPANITYTVGSNETYLSASTYGVLLASKSVGTDVNTDVGSLGRLTHYVTGANAVSVTYTPSTSDTFTGYGYVFFKHLR